MSQKLKKINHQALQNQKLKKNKPPSITKPKTKKKQTTKHYKTDHPKKIKFVGCFVAIRVQRWFVKLKVAPPITL